MPRLRSLLPLTNRAFTKVPNELLDRWLPVLKDTELRVLLVLLRITSGWNQEGQAVTFPYRRFIKHTGRSSEAISKAIESLLRQGLIHKPLAVRFKKPKK